MLKLVKFLLKKWQFLIIIFLSVAGQAVFQLMIPEYMGKIQNTIASSAETGGVVDTTQILVDGGYMLLFTFCVVICAITTGFLAAHISSHIGKELREEVFGKVINMNLATYNKFGTATLITRTTNDIEQVKNFWLMAVRIMIQSPTMMILAIIKTVTLDQNNDTNLALVIAFCVPLVLLVFIVLFAIAAPLFKKIQIKVDNVTTVLRESLTGIRVIRAYNQQNKETEKFTKVNSEMTQTIQKVGHTLTFANPTINIIFNVCFIGLYAWGFYAFNGLALTAENTANVFKSLANISVVTQYAMNIMMSFLFFAIVFVNLPQASASAKRINEILETEEIDTEASVLTPEEIKNLSKGAKGLIEFKNVSFQYPDSKSPCISNINFTVKPGTTTAIIGSTGSGKSSIINLLPRFYDSTQGQILFDHVDITMMSKSYLRSRIGFVPQTALLFSGTIKENILFGNEHATENQIIDALDVAQASHFISKTEKGLDTFVSQSGKNFSGGQKQRLAIARALVRNPEVFVFDDSFSALDFKTDIKLRSALKHYIAKDASVLIVAQRVSTIINADDIIVLDDGKIVGEGKHDELLRSCPIYRDIVNSQLDPDEVQKTLAMHQEAIKEGGK